MKKKNIYIFYIVINFIILCLVYLSLLSYKPFWDTQLRTSNLLIIIIIINSLLLIKEYYFNTDVQLPSEENKNLINENAFKNIVNSGNLKLKKKVYDSLAKNWQSIINDFKKLFSLAKFEQLDTVKQILEMISSYSGAVALLIIRFEENGIGKEIITYGTVPNYILNSRIYLKDGELIFEYPSNIGKELITDFNNINIPVSFASDLFHNILVFYPLNFINGSKGLLIEVTDSDKTRGISRIVLKILRSFVMILVEYAINMYILSLQQKEVSKIDNQTGFLRFEYFNETLDTEIERSERYNQCLTLMIFRINLPKEYEESEFNEIRKALVKAMRLSLRRLDLMICGPTDNEFIAILTEANVEIAKLIAQRVINSFEKNKQNCVLKSKPFDLYIASSTYPINASCSTNLISMAKDAIDYAVEKGERYISYSDLAYDNRGERLQ